MSAQIRRGYIDAQMGRQIHYGVAHHADAVRQERPDITVKVLNAGDRVAASHVAIRSFLGSSG